MLKYFILFFVVFTVKSIANEMKPIISITEFCPFMCTKSNKQGFAVDIVDKVFKNSGLEVSFEASPWARAVKNASSGVISGILAPGKDEAPLLMYPSEPIALQQNCFFQNHTSSWRYVDKSSLTNKKIIVFTSWAHAKDLKQDIGEDEYTNIFTEYSYDGNYYQKAINMVNKGRADAFWADPSVIKYLKLEGKVGNAGCISSHYLYVGFSPIDKAFSQKLIEIFDNGFKQLKRTGEYESILEHYNLTSALESPEIDYH